MDVLELLRHGPAAALIFAGVALSVVASIGAFRFTDVFQRVHALRAGAVFAPLLLVGLALESFDLRIALRLGVLAIVLAMIGPGIAHLLAQAAHRGGIVPAERKPARPPT